MSVRRAGSRGRRGRANRSRQLERHEEKRERTVGRLLGVERERKDPKWKPIPDCPDCGCNKYEHRRILNGSWPPFCIPCWIKRGNPDWKEARRLADEIEAARREELAAEHQARVDAGEVPW